MITDLENLLFEKTKGKQSEVLHARWNYDKKLIPSALNSVSNLFPHYSLHDESHSITILNNIYRILGKNNIEKLSAIDIWMLLEASYSHDLGMIVTSKEIINTLKDTEFISFFKILKENHTHSLNEFTNHFEVDNAKILFKNKDFDFEIFDGMKFILAEFFRQKHSERSVDIINNKNDNLIVNSQNDLIPERIFKLLGEICESHTKDFSEILKLPFKQVGIDTEDVHPRFIACLLRIGDLLDLDNNRFSDVMLRTLVKIPKVTSNHIAKHLSIEYFRIDQSKVEIKARCTDYETTELVQHWFDYINSEFTNQILNWSIISPSFINSNLPSLGELEVDLVGYETIDGKNKPKFNVDPNKALELLKGAGIYKNPQQSIRELLQNAVDSTLIKIWLENKNLKDVAPQNEIYSNLRDDNSIEIHINEIEILNNIKRFEIEIIDTGVGISKNDLKYILNIGSSSKNMDRNNIINEMPFWLQPSGIFGIGFLSVFLLTNKVNICSKNLLNDEIISVNFNSPFANQNGLVLIKRDVANYSKKIGTSIKFEITTDTIPKRYTISIGENYNAENLSKHYDPFVDKSFDVEIAKLIDEIILFNFKSVIPIKLFFNEKELIKKNTIKIFNYYDEINSIEFNIHIKGVNFSAQHSYFYKYQRIENSTEILFLFCDFNIHKHKASKVLRIDRNGFRNEFYPTLFHETNDSLYRKLVDDFQTIFINEEHAIIGSFFLNYYFSDLNVKKFNQWEKYKILNSSTNTNINFIKLIEQVNEVNLKIYKKNNKIDISPKFTLTKKKLTIEVNNSYNHSLVLFLLSKYKDIFSNCRTILKNENEEHYLIDFSNFEIKENDLIKLIQHWLSSSYSNRIIIPCSYAYFKLRIKDNINLPYVNRVPIESDTFIKSPSMISPFTKKINPNKNNEILITVNESLYNWVYENRFEQETTLDEIIATYKLFLKDYEINKFVKNDLINI